MVGREPQGARGVRETTAATGDAFECRIAVADGVVQAEKTWNRQTPEAHYSPCIELARQGAGVLCGEGGAHNRTSHPVILAWLWDAMEVPKGRNMGRAVWRFRRFFGILESGCADVEYQGSAGASFTGRCSPCSSSTESGLNERTLDISSAPPDNSPLISDNGPFDGLPECDAIEMEMSDRKQGGPTIRAFASRDKSISRDMAGVSTRSSEFAYIGLRGVRRRHPRLSANPRPMSLPDSSSAHLGSRRALQHGKRAHLGQRPACERR